MKGHEKGSGYGKKTRRYMNEIEENKERGKHFGSWQLFGTGPLIYALNLWYC